MVNIHDGEDDENQDIDGDYNGCVKDLICRCVLGSLPLGLGATDGIACNDVIKCDDVITSSHIRYDTLAKHPTHSNSIHIYGNSHSRINRD